MNEKCQIIRPDKIIQVKKRGKVIQHFIVEVVVSGADPTLDINSSNPYTQMSEEERLRDLIEIFSLLWAESCKNFSRTENLSREIKRLLLNK